MMLINSEVSYINTQHFDVKNCIKVKSKYAAAFDLEYSKLFKNEWYNLCMELYKSIFRAYKPPINTDKMDKMLVNDNGWHPGIVLEFYSSLFGKIEPYILQR